MSDTTPDGNITNAVTAIYVLTNVKEQEFIIVVAKKADRTAYDVRYIAAKPNRGKWCGVWNSGHMTTLLVATPDAEISAVRFMAVCCG